MELRKKERDPIGKFQDSFLSFFFFLFVCSRKKKIAGENESIDLEEKRDYFEKQLEGSRGTIGNF